MAPDEVHTAVRRGVTVPGGPNTELCGQERTFLRADSPARRAKADAMSTRLDAAPMRKNSRSRRLNSAPLRYCNATPPFETAADSLNESPLIYLSFFPFLLFNCVHMQTLTHTHTHTHKGCVNKMEQSQTKAKQKQTDI